MWPPIRFTKRTRQSGFVLVEAMISMVVVALVVTASVYTMGRGMNAQYTANLRAQAVEQLRALLMSQGVALCSAAGPTITINGHSYAVAVSQDDSNCQGYTGAVTVTLPGQSAVSVTAPATQLSPMSLSVSSPAFGGAITFSTG